LILKGEYIPKVSENRELRRISGLKRDEVIEKGGEIPY
jgi:hypothetical protein